MTKQNLPGWQPVTPEPGSRGWNRIMGRGCGAAQDYWGEWDCTHGYTWKCDQCPLVIAAQEEEMETETNEWIYFT